MINLLILSKYEDLGASSRLRSLDYIEYFAKENIQTTVSALFDNEYLERLYTKKKRSKSSVLKYYLNRLIFILFNLKKYDVIFIEKELFPYLPGLFEKLISIANIPYIVDYDDAIFHNYDLTSSKLKKFFLKNKLKPLLSKAACTTVGNSYLETLAIQNGAKKVIKIPTVINIERYYKEPVTNFDEITIGWIGSPSTTKYLKLIWPALEKIKKHENIKLITIGADNIDYCPIPLKQYPWTLDTECEILKNISIGVMPLEDGPWEKGKCGYKLIQYMASSKPVIASNVGFNTEVVTPDVGYLAETQQQWVDAINNFLNNPELMLSMGINARRRVEQHYTIQINSEILSQLIKKVAKK
ncbi:glycosyltransferase family 4 protein [Leclercia pneumoniae]|uniref:glycosyltransferase family 4 protein n=1 Tax=Leclercia pneumoniae TaxID=2815358 RepID=UPI0030D58D6C